MIDVTLKNLALSGPGSFRTCSESFGRFLSVLWSGESLRAGAVPIFRWLRVVFSLLLIQRTLIMVPQRKGSAVERAVRGVRERARQAKAFIKPAGKFLRRDSQLSIMAISIVSPGNQYSNSCRETSHQCYVHPRLQGLLGCWTGFPHLRTDLGLSPARGPSPIVLVAQGPRDEPIDPSITSLVSWGGGVLWIRTIQTDTRGSSSGS